MPAYELVVFDCDGVLVDSERITNQIFVDVLNEEGIPARIEEMARHFVGHSLEQCMDIIARIYGRRPGADFLARYRPRRDAALRKGLQPVPGIEQVLRQLQLPHCVASNSSAAKVREMLDITGLRPYFHDKIFSASDLGKPKPAPDVYLRAAESQGVKPSDCLVIEDTDVGVTAAVAAGMRVCAYTGTMEASRLLKAGAVQTVDNMLLLPDIINRGVEE
ncbi:HAD family hydrolase [Methylobacillus flagellatus]|uniref:HAD-superfamily hydrolase subfamily IA, variant 3 n=1 Tax=Methylobacillus flagellatus (strain ATCC 51484 / DSM 6875 / VKM B-1610 / KT) TaxID=265072 RepID=Q1H126_METFK|nr:HAD family phosphatase [Methylobacillus flagellatus]ABE49811.1 HAD-superfamily hydrolase subfamily IA, variant 3 [Methylobacillus flagellatus KT]